MKNIWLWNGIFGIKKLVFVLGDNEIGNEIVILRQLFFRSRLNCVSLKRYIRNNHTKNLQLMLIYFLKKLNTLLYSPVTSIRFARLLHHILRILQGFKHSYHKIFNITKKKCAATIYVILII